MENGFGGDNEEVFGDFEDLETGKITTGKTASKMTDENERVNDGGEEDKEADQNAASRSQSQRQQQQHDRKTAYEKRLAKKEKLKSLFNSEYDKAGAGDKAHFDQTQADMEVQTFVNRTEFANDDEESRLQFEGFRPGLYVRLELAEVPCRVSRKF